MSAFNITTYRADWHVLLNWSSVGLLGPADSVRELWKFFQNKNSREVETVEYPLMF